MGGRIQECEVRAGLSQGGGLRGAVIVCRPGGNGLEHLAWIWTSWLAGPRLLYTFRARDVRGYRNLDLLVALIRDDWGYQGPITLRLHDDPALALAEGISASLVRADGSRRLPQKSRVSQGRSADGG